VEEEEEVSILKEEGSKVEGESLVVKSLEKHSEYELQHSTSAENKDRMVVY